MRCLVLLILSLLVTGCSTTRDITFTAVPADADLTIDGVRVGKGPVTQEITFKGAEDEHTFAASRKGFQDATVKVLRDHEQSAYQINLKPQTRKITVGIRPVPAIIKVDGKPISNQFEPRLDHDLEFRVDANDKWIPLTIRAERQNFTPAEVKVNFEDPRTTYMITMGPMTKDITIDSTPAGADIWLDGEPLGKAPATAKAQQFPFDITTGLFPARTIKAQKPGYDAVEKTISWDDDKREYVIDLLAKSKTIRLITEPANCIVELDGTTKLPVDSNGVSTAKLDFPPINDQGDLKTYKITVSKKTTDSEWYPQTITIAWDNAKQDYSVVLKEVLSKPITLTTWDPTRTDDGWVVMPKTMQYVGFKDITEGKGRPSPQQLTKSKGRQIDTIAISPDGVQLVYAVLIPGEKNEFRSQLEMIRTDGTGGTTYATEGKSLDLTPAFTPDGQSIVFSSNRATKRLSVWQTSAVGASGKTQLTTGDNNDLWPNIDADPKPRLFYQSLIGTEARLFKCPVGTTLRTDMIEGTQPRVSPRADAIAFSVVNQRTGKRDIYIMSDSGDKVQNLTNSPDIDECSPSWNKDGSLLAYAADRNTDSEGNRNYDIWVQDLKNEAPTQLTSNGSHDDNPVWDNANNIYFRSNRGFDWNVWKIPAK
jgi:hypothetical protein